jgi:phage tail protein X
MLPSQIDERLPMSVMEHFHLHPDLYNVLNIGGVVRFLGYEITMPTPITVRVVDATANMGHDEMGPSHPIGVGWELPDMMRTAHDATVDALDKAKEDWTKLSATPPIPTHEHYGKPAFKQAEEILDQRIARARKQMPMCTGLLDYFPDALADVSRLSYLGNEKHNPGEPLHWARGKSMDQSDCIIRHQATREQLDYDLGEPILHATMVAWRALAQLQLLIEKKRADGDTYPPI